MKRLLTLFLALLVLALLAVGGPADEEASGLDYPTVLIPPAITTMESNMGMLRRLGR